MRRIGKRVFALLPVVGLFFAGLVILAAQFGVHGPTWATNRANLHIYQGGAIARAGTIYDRNGVVLAQTVDGRRDMPGGAVLRRATLHAVGDPQGFVATGAHSAFRGPLVGFSRAGGLFDLLAYDRGNDITLSIDSRLNRVAWEALNGRPGTVGLFNYQTGEVIVMVSSPSYDPLDKPRNMANNPAFEGVYLNRLLQGLYTPGSTFKVITAYAALTHMPDVMTREFTCRGRFATGEGYVTCMAQHGTLNLERAMAVSCNSVFAQLAVELGDAQMQAAAQRLGFNQRFRAGNQVPLSVSRFSRTPRDPLELGWAGIGQHTTLANPAHMMMIMGAVANEGRGVAPVLTRADAPLGVSLLWQARTAIRIDPAIAAQLRRILLASVDDQRMGGKTGTAQVDDGRPHAWFFGFSSDPRSPYAVVVVVQNGGGGLAQAVPIATRVLREATG